VVSATRKQREVEAREELILDHAHELLEAKGYLGLNLDELADRIEYSKGTIYGHFETKEDLLLGVVIRLSNERARLFRHAARFPGPTRERAAAVGVADNLLNERRPHAFQLMQLVSTASVWEKTSERRRQRLRSASYQIMEPAMGIIREALLAGDIERRDTPPEQILLGLFTMSKGAMLVQANQGAFPAGWSDAVRDTLQINRHRFLDAYGWRPLYDDHDYATVERRMREQHFAIPFDEL
jgi:AcrR family transcriptional regulator